MGNIVKTSLLSIANLSYFYTILRMVYSYIKLFKLESLISRDISNDVT